ncbi:Protein dbl-1 [Anthophora plagiata]
MGKLATTGRLVTRDNEEEQQASVKLLERHSSSASSGRTLAAVPIGGTIRTAPRPGTVSREDERRRRRRGRRRRRSSSSSSGSSSSSSSSRRRRRRRRKRIAVVGFTEVSSGLRSGETARTGDEGFPPNRGEERRVEGAVGRVWEGKEERGGCRYRRGWPSGKRSSSSLVVVLCGIARFVAVVAAAAALCVPAASMPSREKNPQLRGTGLEHRHDLDRTTGLEDVYEDAFEDGFREEEDRPAMATTTRTILDETELDIIRRSIVRGLGLEKIPDPSKANISQAEYERAHREYLRKMQLSLDERQTFGGRKRLHVFDATAYPGNESSQLTGTGGNEREARSRHRLFFPVEIPEEDTVEHATLRLLLHGSTTEPCPVQRTTHLEMLLHLRTFSGSRKLIARKRIEVRDLRDSRWLELDATLAVSWSFDHDDGALPPPPPPPLQYLPLELEFTINGEPVRRTFSSPVLNIFTDSSESETGKRTKRTKRSSPEELMSLHKGRRTKCKGESKKCCRHELTVMFKDLKGFEFIVHPKTFDAGYCKGRCPPKYNPAHHHALLQSLLWKEDRKKVPKPCCAPSKLDQLMIVYFDEDDATQLKVSYWKNIQVLECACS